MGSKLIESLRHDLRSLKKASAISKVTMRQFDAIYPPPVREFSAAEIKRCRSVQEAYLIRRYGIQQPRYKCIVDG